MEDNKDINEPEMFNKFIIDIKKISIDISNSIDCCFKISCNVFRSKGNVLLDGTGNHFQITPDESQDYKIDIEGYKQYQIQMKESDLKRELQSNPLEINIYDKDRHLGTCMGDLNNLFGPDASEKCYGLFYNAKEANIFNGNEIIGTMHYYFALEREECFFCKFCNTYFKPSVVVKHVTGDKVCKGLYLDKDIQELRKHAAERKKRA